MTAIEAKHPRGPRRLEVKLAEIELGAHRLEEVILGGYAYGPPLGEAPIVMIVGGITASPFPFGDGILPEAGGQGDGWWPALCADDLVDPERYTVLCPAWPGNGSSWAGFDEGPPLKLGVPDLADLVAAWLEGIGCAKPLVYLGASLGGLVGIALSVRHPERVERLVSISAGLRPDGWGTATRHLQRELVRDGIRNGDVHTGMARARQLGMLTYRSRNELDTRFGRLTPSDERPEVARYLDHHGQRFAAAFPVNTFLMLSEAIDRCTLADSKEGLREQLERVSADVYVVGVPGDLLFPWSLQNELHRELQAVGATSHLWKLDSDFGHDAFLADQERLAALLREAGALTLAATPSRLRPRFEGVGKQPLRVIRFGMIGCGTVGSGLLELLDIQADELASRYGVRFECSRLSVRDLERLRPPLAAHIPKTDQPLELVADPDVDVVVEVAGGVAPFDSVLRAALAAGKPVVTANKALLAQKLAELGMLAQRTGTPLACEASAAAALPILRHLNHRADEVDRLLAIVNGTSNYVITRLEQDELPMAEAIAEAQAMGLAEADPSLDLDGGDAAAKLSILAYRSFGAWFRPDEFAVRGIRELCPADCDLAETMGFRIRHIARASRVGEAIDLAVEPLLLPNWHLLANVEEEYNAVYLVCRSAGDLSFFGKGAGALPTATAVLGDLIDLAQDNSARWPVPRPIERAAPRPRRHFLRVSAGGRATSSGHAGISRRVESLLRRAAIEVQNRATRAESDAIHLGFLLAPAPEDAVTQALDTIRRLGRIEELLLLGVSD